MSQTRRSICIVTRGSLSYGPRVLKEADALSAAGYAVHVVAYQNGAWVADWDQQLARGRRWRFEAVRCYPGGLFPRLTAFKTGLRQHCYRQLAEHVTFAGGVAEHAFSRPYDELSARARRVPAELYIAHNAEALPVAYDAARARGALLAFDSEDLHSGEIPDDERSLRKDLLTYFERRCLPACRYVTVPSEPVAESLVERYGIPRPITIHNVFPWAERNALRAERKDRRGNALSLYWYSQVVGLDRGLQDCIRALGLIPRVVELHVRGRLTPPVEHELRRLALEHGIEQSFFLHPTVRPDELLARAAEHDVGLALEQPVNRNRLESVSNKLFFCMLAGLALCATDTPGQRSIMQTVPDAGFCYAPGDVRALARGLQCWLDHPEQLARARAAALDAARTRYNFELESQRLLACVERAFGP